MQNAPREQSAIVSTFIKLPFVFKTFVLSIFEWWLKTGFTVIILGATTDYYGGGGCGRFFFFFAKYETSLKIYRTGLSSILCLVNIMRSLFGNALLTPEKKQLLHSTFFSCNTKPHLQLFISVFATHLFLFFSVEKCMH